MLRWTVFGLMLLLSLSCWVPWKPAVIPNQLDASWGLALQSAFLHHLDFGHQVVFTYGPWGFIWQGALPGALNIIVVAWMGLAVVFTAALTTLGRALIPNFWLRAVWMMALGALPCIDVALIQDVRLFAIIWLMLFAHLFGDNVKGHWFQAIKALLLIAAGLASLVKFSILVLAFPVLIIICLRELLNRRLPWAALIYTCSLLVFWIAAHQRVTSFAPYFNHSLIIAGGYPQAQSLSTPDEKLSVAEFLSLAILLLASVSATTSKSRAHPGNAIRPYRIWVANRSLALGGLLICLFVAFKAGYIRHDDHEIGATTALMFLSILHLPLVWRDSRSNAIRCLMSTMVVLAALLLNQSLGTWKNESLFDVVERLVAAEPSRFAGAGFWFNGNVNTESQFNELRPPHSGQPYLPGPPLNGGIDLFGVKQWILIADKLNYRPRPVMQTYAAFEPMLSKLDADFLASASASPNLLFEIAPIDGHYPTMEDSLAWPQIVAAYEPVKNLSSFVLFHRRTQIGHFWLKPLSKCSAKFGEAVEVPEAKEGVWATIQFETTPLGRILQTAYKNPSLTMLVQTASHAIQDFKVIPDMARAGFILSPEFISKRAFATFCEDPTVGRVPAARIVAIKIQADDANASYKSDFNIVFSAMQFSP